MLAIAVVAGWVLPAVPPAHAHVGGGAEPSNYRLAVTSVAPPTAAVSAQVGTGGQWISVTRRGAGAVTVLGYAGEPFLRLSQGRVLVNRHSTTLADNPDLTSVPAAANPDASPQWVPAGEGATAVWSDARLTGDARSGTGTGAAPATRPAPGHGGSGERSWMVPMRVDGAPVTVRGSRTWVAPPSPWPWMAVLAGVTLAAGATGRLRRWHPVAAYALVLAGAANAAHLAGSALAAEPGSAATAWVVAIGTGVLCWPLAGIGAVAALRRSEHAAFAVAVAGTVLAVFSAGDLAVFWHSQLPFAWPGVLERALVVVALGGGAGLALAGVRLVLRGPGSAGMNATGQQPTAGVRP